MSTFIKSTSEVKCYFSLFQIHVIMDLVEQEITKIEKRKYPSGSHLDALRAIKKELQEAGT